MRSKYYPRNFRLRCMSMSGGMYQVGSLKRLHDLPDTKIVKIVYNELNRLHQCGVKTWVTKACELAEQYQVDISSNIQNFKKYCKMTVSNCYKHSWLLEVTNINRNTILRTYTMFKTELRSSSHTLEVERGRYTKPKNNICERLCPVCNVIEDEIHFLANCKLYDAERTHFFGKVTAKIQNLHELNDADKFILLVSSKDKPILVWTGKLIDKCFNIRSRFYLNYCGV